MSYKFQEVKADRLKSQELVAQLLTCDIVGALQIHGSFLPAQATIPMPQFPISGILAVAACGSGDHGASELVGRFISLSTDPSLV